VSKQSRARTERASNEVIDTGISENLITVQDQLREAVGLRSVDTRDIIMTVRLLDGGKFKQGFESATFDSEERDNRSQELYKNILGVEVLRHDGLIGETVPV
jgi:hypothetical protein